jgi:AAA domain
VPIGALVFIAGKPKCFKTYLGGIDWGYSVATGCQWLGRPTKKGRVLYYALEGYQGVLRRAEAWRIFHKKSKADGDDLIYDQERISFAVKTCSVDQHFNSLHTEGFRPDLVIIDTWFKVTAGADVGGQPDMSVALANVRDFQNRLTEWKVEDGLPAVTFVVIAHTDKKGENYFGSITQFADSDVLYQLDRDEGADHATLKCIGPRDIEEPPALTIGMEKVPIVTAKGQEFNLVISKEVTEVTAAAAKASKQTDDLEDMLDILATICRNKATRTEWMTAMQNYGRGWSEPNFDKKLAILKKKGWVTGGGAKGEYYSVADGAGGTTANGGGEADHPQDYPQPILPSPSPPKGGEGDEGNLLGKNDPQITLNEGNEGNARDGGNGSKSVASGDKNSVMATIGAAMQQVKKAEGER